MRRITLLNKEKILSVLRTFGSSILYLIAIVLLSTLLLICVYRLPISNINNHVQSSATVFESEGTYPILFSWCHSQLDNFTDADMLIAAADQPSLGTTLERAMLVNIGYIDGDDTPVDVLTDHYINGTNYDGTFIYPRYWHGYLILLKPLLSIMNYQSIRILNCIVQSLLVIFAIILMLKNNLKELVIPFFLSYLMLMPIALFKSLQFSSCFYILIIGYTAILSLYNHSHTLNPKAVYFIFLNIGILTALFDFLTYPIATFGVPCVLYLYLSSNSSLKHRLSEIIKVVMLWGYGYVGMWASKWIIGDFTTGHNVIQDALSTIAERISASTADGTVHFSLLSVIANNMLYFLRTPVTILCILFILHMIYRLIRNRKLSFKEAIYMLTPYLIISIIPLAWYTFATNHSAIHCSFTNKACVVSCLSILYGFTELKEHNSRKNKS